MKRTSLIYSSLTFILVILTYFIAGFYYETNDDFAMDYSIQGLMGLPVSNFYICLTGFSEAFGWLYNLFPGFPFYSAILYLFLLVSAVNIFFLLDKTLGGFTLMNKICVMILFYYFFLLENTMYFNFTRVAILLCASSLLRIYFLLVGKAGIVRVVLYIVLLFIGALIRGEAFYLGCFIVMPGILLMEFYRSGKPGKLFYQILSVGVIVGVSFQSLKFILNDPVVYEYINLITYVTDYHVIDKTRIFSGKDQLIYEGIYKYFFADENVFSLSNLKSFIDNKSYELFYFNGNKIISSAKQFSYTLSHNYFVFLIVNAGLAFFFFYSEGVNKFLFVLLNVYIWLLLFVTAVLFKVEDRVICPALVIYTLLNMMIVFKQLGGIPFKNVATAVLCLLMILYSVKVVHRVQFSSEKKIQNAAALENIREVSVGSPYVVATVVGRYFTFLDPFIKYNCGLDNKLVRLSGWLSVFPENHELIRRIAGKDSLVDLFQYCLEKEIPIIAETEEIDFLKNFFRVFYGKSLRFEQGGSRNEFLQIYYLKQL